MPGPTDIPGPQPDIIRRLRAWSVSSWRHGDRIAVARATLQALADLTVTGAPRREVPYLGEHALADQLAVLSRGAVAARVDPADVEAIMRQLAARLGFH